MKRSCAAVVLFVSLAMPMAFAQRANDPATREDVLAMLEASQARKQVDSTLETMKKQTMQLFDTLMQGETAQLSKEQRDKCSAFLRTEMESLYSDYPVGELIEAMIPVYQRYYTHGEVQELIQFYHSPLGQKMIAQNPRVTADCMEAMRPILTRVAQEKMKQVQDRMQQFLKQVKDEKSPTEPEAKP
jgi:hypothetical protein